MDRPVDAAALRAAICDETVRLSVQAYGDRLRAIVLTGSLARDEATIVDAGGLSEILGDAEFFLAFSDRDPLPDATTLKSLALEINSSLLQRMARCCVSLSAVRSGYFRGIRPHIFAFELRTWGKVVWGDSGILALIRDFPASAIPLEDAWRLLCNRIIELLKVMPGEAVARQDPRDGIRYRIAKLYLDMATSYLVFKGAYAATYRQRAENLSRLQTQAGAEEELPFSRRDFAKRVAASTHFKLTGLVPEDSFLAMDETEDGSNLWRGSLSTARQLWRWELERLAGVRGNLSDRELMRAWMRHQPVPARARGWLFALRQRGWHRGWRHWPRWARLAWRASPRYWIYAVAFELLGWLADPGLPSGHSKGAGRGLEDFGSWLPATRRGEPHADPWHRLASDLVWNYHEFLVSTRA